MFQPPLNCQGTIFNLHASVEPTPKPKFWFKAVTFVIKKKNNQKKGAKFSPALFCTWTDLAYFLAGAGADTKQVEPKKKGILVRGFRGKYKQERLTWIKFVLKP